MKNLKKIKLSELNEAEMQTITGGLGAFFLGLMLAYYEMRIKPQEEGTCTCHQ